MNADAGEGVCGSGAHRFTAIGDRCGNRKPAMQRAMPKNLNRKQKRPTRLRKPLMLLEAQAGIEPTYTDLQSAA